jgi:hypothetical protein
MSKVVVEGQSADGAGVDQTPTAPFTLKPGHEHTHAGQPVAAGDTVYLTENQAKSFRDKFAPVGKTEFKVQKPEVRNTVKKSTDPGLQPSDEAKQAQADKATAEARAAGIGTVAPAAPAEPMTHRGPTHTVDGAKGTLTADPDGSAQKL